MDLFKNIDGESQLTVLLGFSGAENVSLTLIFYFFLSFTGSTPNYDYNKLSMKIS